MHGPVSRAALPSPPVARRQPVTATHHGVTLVDDYAWLRAANWQEVMRDPSVLDAEIRAYLEAENAYTETALAQTQPLQAKLFAEMKARLKPDDSSVPAPDGPFDYYSNFVAGGQYPRLCRRPRGGGDEHVLLDGNAEAEGLAYWDLGGKAHSPDHRLLAYAVDDKGSEIYTIRIRDLATGEDLPDAIPDTRGEMQWANDSQTLFYIRLDDHHRPLFVYRHRLGTPVSDDVLVYEERDIGFYVALQKTLSGKYLAIDAHDHQTNEIRLIDADEPTSLPHLVEARETGHEYHVDHHWSHLLILTNSEDAEDFRVVAAPVHQPGRANWREIVPHKAGRLILDMQAYGDYLVRLEREDSLPRLVITPITPGIEVDREILDLAGEHRIAFAEEAYALGMSEGYEFKTTTLRFTYSSMTTPAETYDYDMAQRTRVLRKRQEIPSGHNPDDYVTRRLFAPAKDGETVPVSILYRKGTPLDGSAPLFLYGYGSYGISIPASFSTARLSLVDRGFIFAIAHIRGGKDKGYRWYTDGKHKTKRNTFTDFIAAGEHLAAEGLTRRGRIVANGGSAGGMLMGAVANMAPDLFLGLIADVPFVDVLNTMLDKDLPLTPPEWPEWGNPIESAEDFAIIRSYSPYDNVEAKTYPHILAFAGLTDPRVTYWEPAKWIARLRQLNTSDNLVLLKTNMEAGHGGASGRFERLRETAIGYAFALEIAGLAEG
ncbi:S9 family peptidase [Hyphomicrobium sp.]|uniref:S9 family peptidase n=1 Tax=Hyphomicrobium sp. TaxID=82 RepID=UPI0025C638E2|nr:S9 family peptidase [Hyphomicrobium sp.]MCC7252346.1 S9 family peptidase [Hyphomicrobium sp.]